MTVTDGELIITQTEKATKHAIISEIRNDKFNIEVAKDIGVNIEVADYINELIERIENLKV